MISDILRGISNITLTIERDHAIERSLALDKISKDLRIENSELKRQLEESRPKPNTNSLNTTKENISASDNTPSEEIDIDRPAYIHSNIAALEAASKLAGESGILKQVDESNIIDFIALLNHMNLFQKMEKNSLVDKFGPELVSIAQDFELISPHRSTFVFNEEGRRLRRVIVENNI